MNQKEWEVAFAEACYYAIEKYCPMLLHSVLTLARDRLGSHLISTREQMIEEVDKIFQEIREEHPTVKRSRV